MKKLTLFLTAFCFCGAAQATPVVYDLVFGNGGATGNITLDIPNDIDINGAYSVDIADADILEWTISFDDDLTVVSEPYNITQDFRGRDLVNNGARLHAAYPLNATEEALTLSDDLGASLLLTAYHDLDVNRDYSISRWQTAIDWGRPNWWLEQPLDLTPHLYENGHTNTINRWESWSDIEGGESIIGVRQPETLIALQSHSCSSPAVVPEPTSLSLLLFSTFLLFVFRRK